MKSRGEGGIFIPAKNVCNQLCFLPKTFCYSLKNSWLSSMVSEEFHSNVQLGSGLIVVCLQCVDCQYAKKLGSYLMLILELCRTPGGKTQVKTNDFNKTTYDSKCFEQGHFPRANSVAKEARVIKCVR